jgi:CRP-like cAMP-binding protein
VTEQDEISVPKGTILFRQGDPSDSMFVVASGRIRLTLGAGAEVREIGTLGAGDFFGEISLLTGAERTATAEVIEDSRLLVVGRDAFRMMVQDDLATVTRMLSAQGERLSRTNDPIQDGVQRLARCRVIAAVLRTLGAAMRLPCRLSVAGLAADFTAPLDALERIVDELVARGAGTRHDDAWTLSTQGEVDALIAALAVYAG